MAEFKKFCSSNERLPSSRSKDPLEKTNGQWIVSQKTSFRNDKLSQDRLEQLRTVEEWVQWENGDGQKKKIIRVSEDDRMAEFKKFCSSNERLPSSRSKDPLEKTNGQWIVSQKTSFRNDKLSQDRLEQLRTVEEWVRWENKLT